MRRLRQSSICCIGATLVTLSAQAEDAGLRDFPATLVVDEPQVETEVSPQIAAWAFADRGRRDVSSELSLQLTKPFAVIFSPIYTALARGRGGFQAFGFGTKYQFLADAKHEFILSAGVSSTLGGTGSASVGADTFSSLVPTVYFGKGFGELPGSLGWARPFAITGEVGLEVPTRPRSREAEFGQGIGGTAANPVSLRLQGSLQYNFIYAVANRSLGGWSKTFDNLVPIVEYELEVPIGRVDGQNVVVGTINPGFLLVDERHHTTWGLEALLPVNRASGNHPGARLQLSYSFDTPWHLAGKVPD